MFDAYGDESSGPRIAAYGVVLVGPDSSEALYSAIADLKSRYRAHASARLHCRELFAGHARQKGPWAHLGLPEVYSLYEDLASVVKQIAPRRLACVARKSHLPKALSPSPWVSNDGVGLPEMGAGIPLGNKQLTTLCAQGATLPLAHAPGHANVRFWPDRDATPIAWFDGNAQSHNKMDNFVDLGEGVEPTQLNVMKTPCPKPALLEVADALAYFAQRRWTVGTNPGKPQVKRIYAAFGAHEIRLKVAGGGGFYFDVPNASRVPL